MAAALSEIFPRARRCRVSVSCRIAGPLWCAKSDRQNKEFEGRSYTRSSYPRVSTEASQTEIDKYHQVRSARNAVAHRDPITLTMRQAVEMNCSSRDLAVKIASYMTDNFFVIEKYIP